MGSVNNGTKEETMTRVKDNLLEITVNVVVALAVLSTLIKVTL